MNYNQNPFVAPRSATPRYLWWLDNDRARSHGLSDMLEPSQIKAYKVMVLELKNATDQRPSQQREKWLQRYYELTLTDRDERSLNHHFALNLFPYMVEVWKAYRAKGKSIAYCNSIFTTTI